MRALFGAASLALLGACGSDVRERPGAPEPPAQTGECEPTGPQSTPDGEPLPSRPTFRPSELEPLLARDHEAPLFWPAWLGAAAGDATVTAHFEVDAATLEEHPGCVSYVELEGQLSLSSSDDAFSIDLPVTMSARSARQLAVRASAESDRVGELHERLAALLQQTGSDTYPLELEVDGESLTGGLQVQSGQALCPVAAWPARRRCPLGVAEVALAQPLRGHDLAELAAELGNLGALGLAWEDGSTALSLEVEADGETYCRYDNLPDLAGRPSQRARAEVPVRLHVMTDDQNLDVWLAARAVLEVDDAGERESASLRAHAIAEADSNASFAIAAPDLAVVELRVELDEGASRGDLSVRSLTPHADALTAKDIAASCLEGELFGQLRDVAHGTW
jgi:hypothetical protein